MRVQLFCVASIAPTKMRHTPGVGLGPSLVAAIMKLHGFQLIIHPGPGGRIDIACPADKQPK